MINSGVFDIVTPSNHVEAELVIPAKIQGLQGKDGEKGKDALINGSNTVEIVAGQNVTIKQEGETLTINSLGGDVSYLEVVDGCLCVKYKEGN